MARPSRVRSAILELLEGSSRHDWTIEAVQTALADRDVPADQSSVFRGLVRLAEEQSIDSVDLGDGKLRFEGRRQHHEHVACDRCGAVGAVPGCLVEEVIPRVERQTGFVVTGHRLLLGGVCGRCAARSA